MLGGVRGRLIQGHVISLGWGMNHSSPPTGQLSADVQDSKSYLGSAGWEITPGSDSTCKSGSHLTCRQCSLTVASIAQCLYSLSIAGSELSLVWLFKDRIDGLICGASV